MPKGIRSNSATGECLVIVGLPAPDDYSMMRFVNEVQRDWRSQALVAGSVAFADSGTGIVTLQAQSDMLDSARDFPVEITRAFR